MSDRNPAKTTQSFRDEHVEIQEHLSHIDKMIRGLTAASASDRKTTMNRIVHALRSHILEHAAWEEKVLYPVVDAKAGGGRYPFTAAMRHEHRIVGRWIDRLDAEAQDPSVDPSLFASHADQLVGLILAHFEDEEEVLLPILDETMTHEEFEREILSKGNPHQKS